MENVVFEKVEADEIINKDGSTIKLKRRGIKIFNVIKREVKKNAASIAGLIVGAVIGYVVNKD